MVTEIRVPSANEEMTGAVCPPSCAREPLKFVPTMSNRPPPVVGPAVALIRAIVGAAALTVIPALADMPLKCAARVDEPAAPAVTSPVELTVAAPVLVEEYVVPALAVTFCVLPSEYWAVKLSCCVPPGGKLMVAGDRTIPVSVGAATLDTVTARLPAVAVFPERSRARAEST